MELNMCFSDFKRNKDHTDYGKLSKYVSLRYFTMLQQLMKLVSVKWEQFENSECEIWMDEREMDRKILK
jgi:hypothetical protein